MSNQSFSLRAEQFLEELQAMMESSPALEDLDIDLVDGVLTLEFDDGGQVIINRQSSAEQIWLVSQLGPAHFNYDKATGNWCDDRNGETLVATLNQAFTDKLGVPVSLSPTQ